ARETNVGRGDQRSRRRAGLSGCVTKTRPFANLAASRSGVRRALEMSQSTGASRQSASRDDPPSVSTQVCAGRVSAPSRQLRYRPRDADLAQAKSRPASYWLYSNSYSGNTVFSPIVARNTALLTELSYSITRASDITPETTHSACRPYCSLAGSRLARI